MKHKMSLHLHISGSFPCDSCPKSFSNMYNLNRHKKTHDENQKSNKCDSCKKSFERNDVLEKHKISCKRKESSHLPSVYLPDKLQSTASKDTQREKIIPTCNTCQKTFTGSDGLTKHVPTHANFVKKYECVSCEKKFSRKDNYNVHMKQQKKVIYQGM